MLLKDFCTSNHNLKRSRWPKPDAIRSGTSKLLERLRDDYRLSVDGMNVYFTWETGSDLDINVMCGCGKWHGYGTTGGSEGNIICRECEMTRDYDVQTGPDGRKNAFEHAFFAKPEKLYNKKIGIGVHNYR